jgi:acyl-coenzyme A synthetase/AMP-(fatty) acid ligase
MPVDAPAPPGAAIAGASPLTARAASEVIYRRSSGPVTVGRFLAEATALAAQLPEDGRFAANLCADRYLALLGFGAALVRGHVTLLNADPAPGRLHRLAASYPGTYAIADRPLPASPVPVVNLDCDPWHGAAAGPAALPPSILAERIVAIGFTSGSTGEPTAHPKPWGALVAAAEAAAERFGLGAAPGGEGARPPPPTSLVATVPPQHMYGFETTIVLPLHASVAPYAGESFFPSDVLDALAALPAPLVLITTPVHLRPMLAEGRRPRGLSAVISATAPLSPALAEAVERDWDAPVLEIYGATEAGSLASRRTVAEPDWLPYRGVGMEAARGVAIVPGLGEVPLEDEMKPEAGGRFRLLGRRADLVKLGGRRASLAELNRQLAEVEGVQDGIFLAPEDIERNPAARLTAYVVAPGCGAEEILAGLRGRVDPVFLPRPLVLVPALPRDALGKLPRGALARLKDGTGGTPP